MTNTDILHFQIRSCVEGQIQRHLLIDRTTHSSSLIAGLYESNLAASSLASSTIQKALSHVAALLTWDAETGCAATSRLIYRHPLTGAQIKLFKRWLKTRAIRGEGLPSATKQETVNTILRGAANFEDWCLKYALVRHGYHSSLGRCS